MNHASTHEREGQAVSGLDLLPGTTDNVGCASGESTPLRPLRRAGEAGLFLSS